MYSMNEANFETKVPTVITEFHKAPRQLFVELIVVNSDGVPINTFAGENPALPGILQRIMDLAQDNGFPIAKRDALLTLAQDIYEVDRELVLSLLGVFYTKHWSDIKDIQVNLPQTAKYFFVVSR